MYKVDSKIAEEFINHQEILDTLDYAEENKNNKDLLDEVLEKAKKEKEKAASNDAAEYVSAVPAEDVPSENK